MADTLTTQVYDGARNYQIKLVDDSDGTGLLAAKVVDVTTMHPNPGVHMKLKRIRFSIYAMRVELLWEASTPVPIAIIGPGEDILDFSREYAGGWPDNAGVGVTGSVLMTTRDQVAGSGFTIVLEFIKGV